MKKPTSSMVSAKPPKLDYAAWIAELKQRYRATQIKAAVAVNSALIEFYWNLGKDISERYGRVKGSEIYGSRFFIKLSSDLKDGMSEVSGLSPQNIRYCLHFFELYAPADIFPQVVGKSSGVIVADQNFPQVVGQLVCVPWGHHRTIIDKCKGDREKALFYVRRTIQNGWSRNSLLNWLSTDLYEREGKAQTNFALTMPSDDCDLARQLVKDPQVFEVFGLKERYDETELKAAIVANIESALLSLGRGISFVGREYPVEIGGETKSIDLLFYVIPLHRYLVMEVKTGKYEPADLGQLTGYMAMAKHVLNTPIENPPIGVLVCKEHNRVLAKFHMEELKSPVGITDYELKKVLPTSAQLAKCYADAEARFGAVPPQPASRSDATKNRKTPAAKKGARK